MSKLQRSFLFGGLAGVGLIILGIFLTVYSGDAGQLAAWSAIGVMAFTLISCIILDNNFVEDMVSGIFSWGFVRMPGLIFTLDLDGIIWLITVKLLFWVLGILLAILTGTLAIVLGLVVSVFVYPFALMMELSGKERTSRIFPKGGSNTSSNGKSQKSGDFAFSQKSWYCSCGALNPGDVTECQTCFAQRPR